MATLNLYRLDLSHPMAGARIVRTQRVAWPGGYPLVLVVNDGCWLCSDCVQDNFAQISWAHRNRQNNGWRPEGYAVVEEANLSTYCSHCGEWILEPEDAEDDEPHPDQYPEDNDSPELQNCDDWGTGEGQYHGRM